MGRKLKHFSDEEQAELSRRYNAGESCAELARATGHSRTVISRELGVPLRSRRADQTLRWRLKRLRKVDLLARVKELEAGLAFYADEANYRKLGDDWPLLEDSDVQLDRGSLARAALAVEAG